MIGEALDAALPLPLKVEGREVEDTTGTVIVQYVVPIDRSALEAQYRAARQAELDDARDAAAEREARENE